VPYEPYVVWDLAVLGHAGSALDLPTLLGSPLPPLLFADDLALISSSLKGLQVHLALLHRYAEECGFTVNFKKTVVVVFRAGAEGSRREWQYGAHKLAEAKPFIYLGTRLTARSKAITGAAGDYRVERATATRHAMRRWAMDLAITMPALMCDLFDSLVLPSMQFGVEMWGPMHLLKMEHGVADRLHMGFLKRLGFLFFPVGSTQVRIFVRHLRTTFRKPAPLRAPNVTRPVLY
jgi:hypothetical protein